MNKGFLGWISFLGIGLIVLVLGCYGWFIRPEATKAYSQIPTSGVFITAVVGITIIIVTSTIANTWQGQEEQKASTSLLPKSLDEVTKSFITDELKARIGAIDQGYQELILKERKALQKNRLEYLLRFQDAHKKKVEHLDEKGNVTKRIIEAPTIDVQQEFLKLLDSESEEVSAAIAQLQASMRTLEMEKEKDEPAPLIATELIKENDKN